MQKFELGQTVRLKSGGPLMTVNSIDEEKNQIECVWFLNYNKKTDRFHPDTIKPDDDNINLSAL